MIVTAEFRITPETAAAPPDERPFVVTNNEDGSQTLTLRLSRKIALALYMELGLGLGGVPQEKA